MSAGLPQHGPKGRNGRAGVGPGLMNMGNTCYFNATLQALRSVNNFSECLKRLQWDHAKKKLECMSQDVHGTRSRGSDTISLGRELQRLFRTMDSGKDYVQRPDALYNAFIKCFPFFGGFTQQDAQECMHLLLDRIHHEILDIIKSRSPKTLGSLRAELRKTGETPLVSNDQLVALKVEKVDTKLSDTKEKTAVGPSKPHGPTLVQDTFQGTFISEVHCAECDEIVRKFDPFYDVSVTIPTTTIVITKTKRDFCYCKVAEPDWESDDWKFDEHHGFYVECESCNKWFHGKCVGFKDNLDAAGKEFICRDCKPTPKAELVSRESSLDNDGDANGREAILLESMTSGNVLAIPEKANLDSGEKRPCAADGKVEDAIPMEKKSLVAIQKVNAENQGRPLGPIAKACVGSATQRSLIAKPMLNAPIIDGTSTSNSEVVLKDCSSEKTRTENGRCNVPPWISRQETTGAAHGSSNGQRETWVATKGTVDSRSNLSVLNSLPTHPFPPPIAPHIQVPSPAAGPKTAITQAAVMNQEPASDEPASDVAAVPHQVSLKCENRSTKLPLKRLSREDLSSTIGGCRKSKRSDKQKDAEQASSSGQKDSSNSNPPVLQRKSRTGRTIKAPTRLGSKEINPKDKKIASQGRSRSIKRARQEATSSSTNIMRAQKRELPLGEVKSKRVPKATEKKKPLSSKQKRKKRRNDSDDPEWTPKGVQKRSRRSSDVPAEKLTIDFDSDTPRFCLKKFLKENPMPQKQKFTYTVQQSLSLHRCLKKFCAKEKLQDDFECPRCKCSRPGFKQIQFMNIPDTLCLHLKRFSWTRNSKAKIRTKITFPLSNLDLSDYMHEDAAPAARNDPCVKKRVDDNASMTASAMNCIDAQELSPQSNPMTGSGLSGCERPGFVYIPKLESDVKMDALLKNVKSAVESTDSLDINEREKKPGNIQCVSTLKQLDLKSMQYDASVSNHGLQTNSASQPGSIEAKSIKKETIRKGLEPLVYDGSEENLPFETIYDLVAVVSHHGSSMGSGHYTAFTRRGNGPWAHYNDSRATPVSEAKVASSEPYMLFYQRRGTALDPLSSIELRMGESIERNSDSDKMEVRRRGMASKESSRIDRHEHSKEKSDPDPGEQRIILWNKKLRRKLFGNAAPMARNLAKYLKSHRQYEVYTDQDKVAASTVEPSRPLNSTVPGPEYGTKSKYGLYDPTKLNAFDSLAPDPV